MTWIIPIYTLLMSAKLSFNISLLLNEQRYKTHFESTSLFEIQTFYFYIKTFYPGVIAPDSHWLGTWVGHIAGMALWRSEKSCPCWESNPGRPARCYTD
jgi:hypothetical protein